MIELFTKTINSPIGLLTLQSNETELLAIQFSKERISDTHLVPEILKETEEQLLAYFSGNLKEFIVKLSPEGTEFQQNVWELVKAVGYGEKASYLDVAKKLGDPNFTRAVGMANGKNPIPIIIPCHRIVGSNGKLTGYAGGLEKKKWLLLHEQSNTKTNTLF